MECQGALDGVDYHRFRLREVFDIVAAPDPLPGEIERRTFVRDGPTQELCRDVARRIDGDVRRGNVNNGFLCEQVT